MAFPLQTFTGSSIQETGQWIDARRWRQSAEAV
jgi:hypothetical protein